MVYMLYNWALLIFMRNWAHSLWDFLFIFCLLIYLFLQEIFNINKYKVCLLFQCLISHQLYISTYTRCIYIIFSQAQLISLQQLQQWLSSCNLSSLLLLKKRKSFHVKLNILVKWSKSRYSRSEFACSTLDTVKYATQIGTIYLIWALHYSSHS